MGTLYNRIEELCKKNKINITVMCKESGASRGALTDLKVGRTNILSAVTLSKIADYFNVSVDYLLGNDVKAVNNDLELSEYLEELRTRPEMRMIFQLAKNATKEDVEKAVKIIEALFDK